MRRRLQEYERGGVQATLDMQQAARAVALENDGLRALLAHHGILSDGIERFLQLRASCHGDWDTTSGPPHSTQHRRPSSSLPGSRNSAGLRRTGSRGAPVIDLSAAAVAPSDRNVTGSSSHEKPKVYDDDGQDSSGPYNGGRDDGESAVLASMDPPPLPPTAAPIAGPVAGLAPSTMETSCDTAATIIANAHGHEDKSQAFAALGCTGMKDCVVKNIRIFDLISQII